MHKSPLAVSIVTGNQGKAKELTELAKGLLKIEIVTLDLPELQSLELSEIITDKLKKAYHQVGGPVIVDDVSAELSCLRGLPGPFIRFYIDQLGRDALSQLVRGNPDNQVIIRCQAGYYDGTHLIIGEGALNGSVVEPRGHSGFGFGVSVVPDGHTVTLAEMTDQQRIAINHRSAAFSDLIHQLQLSGILPAD